MNPVNILSSHFPKVGKHEGNNVLGRHQRRWEDNIRMDAREIGWEGVDWIHLPHGWLR
jgi:hypothetical protein